MNNNPWYVTIHHWDDVCDDYADVKFFPSAKAATDYATEQRDKFRTSYESDNYGIEILSGTSNAAYHEPVHSCYRKCQRNAQAVLGLSVRCS